ncbi:MAG: AAA family ATPase, partial [Pseudomonadota bacterium]
LALLAREHVLFLGPPGTAKSLLARSMCQSIQNATYFERLLTRFSTPEELFGPLSLAALENDRYQRVTSGTIVEAHIVFLDEVFKANSAILNSLLGIINERTYYEAGQACSVPLLSLFGASNETPEDNSLGALFDRFLVRVTVPALASDESFRRLLDLQPVAAQQATITLDDLATAQALACQVPFTEEAREAIIAIKHGLEEQGISASDRRWKASAKLVRAKAWLDGESQTTADHCDILAHVLWTEPAHIRVVERVVSRVASPLNLESVELEDAAQDLYNQRPPLDHPELTQALEPLLRQLSDIHTRLEQRIHAVPEKRSARARQALVKVETFHRALSQLALRSLSRLHMAPGAA